MRDDISINPTAEVRQDANALLGSLVNGQSEEEISQLFDEAFSLVIGDLQGRELIDMLASLLSASTRLSAVIIRYLSETGNLPVDQLMTLFTRADME